MVLSGYLYVAFAIPWYHVVLKTTPTPGGWFHLRFGKRETQYLVLVVLFPLVLVMIVLFVFAIFSLFVWPKLPPIPFIPDAHIIFATAASVIFILPIFRFFLMFPKIALGQGVQFIDSWRLSRGNASRLVLGMVVIHCFFILMDALALRFFWTPPEWNSYSFNPFYDAFHFLRTPLVNGFIGLAYLKLRWTEQDVKKAGSVV
ncbi:MAG: hypothetical protein HQL52_00620 [Magnetococcales bacterium]|nr:hypothetical protein [Magnetococcales bacterium]